MDNKEKPLIGLIGKRMAAERLRLNFTQKEVCSALGLGAATLSRYENAQRTPDLLQAYDFVKLGYDMHYVLTGERSETIESDLNGEESALLALYRQADDKKMLIKMVKAFTVSE